MKYIIALGAFICCSLLGYSKANALRQRFALLTDLSTNIGRMAENVKMLKMTVPNLLKNLEKSETGILFSMLAEEFEMGVIGNEAWERAYHNAKKRSAKINYLLKPELNLLCELTATLGKLEGESQYIHMSHIQNKMEDLIKRADQDLCSKSKVYLQIGILGGVAFVLLII